jgi:hypothetical protein
MDFSLAGFKEGFIKFLIVIAYVAAAGAISAILDWLTGLDLSQSSAIAVAFVGLVNAILAWLLKWLNTQK